MTRQQGGTGKAEARGQLFQRQQMERVRLAESLCDQKIACCMLGTRRVVMDTVRPLVGRALGQSLSQPFILAPGDSKKETDKSNPSFTSWLSDFILHELSTLFLMAS